LTKDGGAIKQLSIIQTDEANDALIKASNHKFKDVRTWASIEVAKISNYSNIDVLPNLSWGFRNSEHETSDECGLAMKSYGDSAVPHFIKSLESPLDRIREGSAKFLGEIRNSQAVPEIINILLNDSEDLVRVEAANALGRIGNAKAAGPLLETIWDSNPQIRSNSIYALGKLDSISGKQLEGIIIEMGKLVSGEGDGRVRHDILRNLARYDTRSAKEIIKKERG